MSQAATAKPKGLPPLPDALEEPPDISNRYRPKHSDGSGGVRVWCIVGKKSRDELEDYDFPDSQEKQARERLAAFEAVWAKQHARS